MAEWHEMTTQGDSIVGRITEGPKGHWGYFFFPLTRDEMRALMELSRGLTRSNLHSKRTIFAAVFEKQK